MSYRWTSYALSAWNFKSVNVENGSTVGRSDKDAFGAKHQSSHAGKSARASVSVLGTAVAALARPVAAARNANHTEAVGCVAMVL